MTMSTPRFPVQVSRGICFGHALIGHGAPSGPTPRALCLDRYTPQGEAPRSGWPGVVLAFGGAFHRGSRADDAFGEPPNRCTAVADYAMHLAARGYLVCCVDYRLVTEDPVPGNTVVVADPASIPRSRVDVVRQLMGLPPTSAEALWRGVESASDDVAAAVRFVQAQAADWQLDPQRLALGGFSAGARSALNAALGEGIAVAAVVSLSGYMDLADLRRLAGPDRPDQPKPPILLVSAEHDLDYIAAGSAPLVQALHGLGIRCEHAHVPGATHFYPASVAVVDASGIPLPLSALLERFLAQTLGGPLAIDH